MSELTTAQRQAIAIAQARARIEKQEKVRAEVMADMADEVGAWESFLIGTGRGFTNVARGMGLAETEDEAAKAAMSALNEKRPYTSLAGELTGEIAPFIPAGLGVGAIPGKGVRIGAAGLLGATEGGILANAHDQDTIKGSGIGLALGAGIESASPILGRIGRKIFTRLTNKAPEGAILTEAGTPTPEFQKVLDDAGIRFEDLTEDARTLIQNQPAGSNPEQVARSARFQDEGVPASRADITQDFADQAVEQRLLQSANDPIAEQFRQYKLSQSNAIRTRLDELTAGRPLPEDTGELIKDALTGRKQLLRTRKNDLYRQAAEAAEDVGGVPIFPENIRSAVPDADTLEDLAITAPQAIQSLNGILKRYGIIDPSQQEIEAGFNAASLDIKSFERFRKALGAIERGDTTGAVSVAINPIRNALDTEVMELSETLAKAGYGPDVLAPLKEARQVVRQMKTEFSPQAITGRLVDTKKDGVTNIVEASRVYNQMSGNSMPVENVRKVMGSLKNAGPEGQRAIASLQTTTMLDLIDSGFTTNSRTIDGVNTFNPIAFRNRIDQIGKDKLEAIFQNEPQALGRLMNIERIAKDLIPPAGAVPRGSAPVIMDIMNKIGLVGIATKVPGGGLLVETITKASNNQQSRRAVAEAVEGSVDVQQIRGYIEQTLPGIAAASGIAITQSPDER